MGLKGIGVFSPKSFDGYYHPRPVRRRKIAAAQPHPPYSSCRISEIAPHLFPNPITPWKCLINVLSTPKHFFSCCSLGIKAMLLSGAPPTYFTVTWLQRVYPSLLVAPHSLSSLHGLVIKQGCQSSFNVCKSMLWLYMNFGLKNELHRLLFDGMLASSAYFLCNTLIWDFGSAGLAEEILVVFDRMQDFGVLTDPISLTKIAYASGKLKRLDTGAFIHDFVRRNGLEMHVAVSNSLISMYINMGRLELARQLFDNMCVKDTVTWNSMISNYARIDQIEAFELFASMKSRGTTPNRITFLALMVACGQAGDFAQGSSVHGHLIQKGLLWDLQIGTSVMDMYCKCGQVNCARKIFDKELANRSLVSWNSLIAGYSQNCLDYEAVELFNQMLVDADFNPDVITMANLIPSYARFGNLRMAQSIHCFIIKIGYEMDNDVFLDTAMIDAYGKCFDIESAKALFISINKPNAATCNAMLAGYGLSNRVDQALELFQAMLCNQNLDSITLITLFQLYSGLSHLKQAMSLHGLFMTCGFGWCLIVTNSLIDMYMSCGNAKISHTIFYGMPAKNIVTWNTMLWGLARNGLPLVAWKLFRQMQLEGKHKPDPVTLTSLIQVSYAYPGQIETMHGLVLKKGFHSNTLIVNSLIDSYSKGGDLDRAWYLFEQMGTMRDQSSWNVMISGCGMHGRGKEACLVFAQMEEKGHRANSITFLSLLSACSHSALVTKGSEYFELMEKKYGIEPGLEHYTCIIDMYGRAGRLDDANQVLERMPKKLVSDWVGGALLNACKTNQNIELGKHVGNGLLTLASNNCGYYTTLASIYASEGKWEDASKAREVFEYGILRKKPGRSTLMRSFC